MEQQKQQQQQTQNISPEESKQFVKGMDMMIYKKIQEQEAMQGKESVPAVNKHEQEGRTGLVDPSVNQQATNLPQMRKFDQAANYNAIQQALPPRTSVVNAQILDAVQQNPRQFQQQLRSNSSIFNPQQDFIANRVNLALMRKRQDSLFSYA